MKIYGNANSIYSKVSSETLANKKNDTRNVANQATAKSDRVEFSSKAYEASSGNKELTATSGKDSLKITNGDKDGSFVIHFTDSAMVSRAVSRGYLTVNGIDIELTDEMKQQLTQMDKQAQADRERAFNEYILQHETAVAQQQGEAYKKMTDGITQALETASKLSKGKKVSPSEEQHLLETNPQLYAMSKSVASMTKHQKQGEKTAHISKQDNEPSPSTKVSDNSPVELKSYETTLTVSLLDKTQLQDISIAEVDMKL